MKVEKIKPIPKYMVELIRKEDQKGKHLCQGNTRFYAYLTKNDGELVKVTVAVKTRYNKWYCKQVAVHGIDSKDCFIKDIVFYYIGGYIVGWHSEGITREQKWYEGYDWGYQYDNAFDPYAPVINPEYALKIPEFKYSAADKYGYVDILKYLRMYRKYPEAEYFVKMGLQGYATSKTLLQRAHKDMAFRKWLFRNKDEIKMRGYYVETIMKSYKENTPLDETERYLRLKKKFDTGKGAAHIREVFGQDLRPFFTYCAQKNITYGLYGDYLDACLYLKLDMTEPKNRFPHDFMRWHDIRIDECKSAKAREDAKLRKDFYAKFLEVAQKYIGMQYDKKANYIVVIAQSPNDLRIEGETLHHCVGSMNYDQRFVREDSLIFFVREKDKPETPFVTLEYSPKLKQILQCHGDHNKCPDDNTMEFINKKWLPYARKQLKQIA